MSQHNPIRIEIRIELLRAADNLRTAAKELDDAIEAFDRGDSWTWPAGEAGMSIASAHMALHRAGGMKHVAGMATRAAA